MMERIREKGLSNVQVSFGNSRSVPDDCCHNRRNMDIDDVVAQQQTATRAAQRLMMGLSDNPGQVGRDPMRAMINQAWRAQEGQEEGMSYMTVPF